MDARLDIIMDDYEKTDNSFKEKPTFLSLLLGSRKFTQSEVREIWLSGIRRGIEIGLNKASLEGQKIEIRSNIRDERQKEFYERFLLLADSYDCQIQYHPSHGMCVVDLNRDL